MKTMNMLPSDPRVREMNIVQWLWCYHNIMEDMKEEQELFKDQLDRLAFIVNPEVAKKVFEHEKIYKKSKERKQNKSKYEKKDIYNNDVFEKETRAAMLGYDPSTGMSVDEFLQKHDQDKKESSILNDDIDSLLENMEEVDEYEGSSVVGDPDEDPDDFFERAMNFENVFENEATMNIEPKINENVDEFDLDVFEVESEDD